MSTFSIIIPAYQQVSLLKRALDSVLQQEGIDFEVIVTDDSTNDEIQTYVKSLHHPAIRYYRHTSHGNPIENWNFGLGMAEGQYIILMHHDEAMVSQHYLRNVFHKITQRDIVISDVEVAVNDKRRRRMVNVWAKRLICRHPILLFIQNVIGPTACITFKRENMQMFNPELKWLVDVEWYYRMLKGAHISHSGECKIQSIHGHADQITTKLEVLQSFRQDKTIIDNLYGKRIRIALWLYEHLILGTKQLIGKI